MRTGIQPWCLACAVPSWAWNLTATDTGASLSGMLRQLEEEGGNDGGGKIDADNVRCHHTYRAELLVKLQRTPAVGTPSKPLAGSCFSGGYGGAGRYGLSSTPSNSEDASCVR